MARLGLWLGSAQVTARLGSVDLGRWMEIQWTEIKGERLTGVFAGDRGSRWPEKRTHAAEGPGARGKFGKARRSAVNSVGAKVLAGEVSRRRRGAAAVVRTPASLPLLFTAPKEEE